VAARRGHEAAENLEEQDGEDAEDITPGSHAAGAATVGRRASIELVQKAPKDTQLS
jgi:hypothetical protein